MASEENKCRQFEDGLREEIRTAVAAVYHTQFGVLVQAAMRVERSINEGRSPVDRHRSFGTVGGPS